MEGVVSRSPSAGLTLMRSLIWRSSSIFISPAYFLLPTPRFSYLVSLHASSFTPSCPANAHRRARRAWRAAHHGRIVARCALRPGLHARPRSADADALCPGHGRGPLGRIDPRPAELLETDRFFRRAGLVPTESRKKHDRSIGRSAM